MSLRAEKHCYCDRFGPHSFRSAVRDVYDSDNILQLPPRKRLIFGNSSLGTPVMLASPSRAIDLLLKIVAAQDEKGAVRASYNSADYLQAR